ncbi:nitroreductase [Parvibaculum lavamentivorans DS-1]|uniref:Putative NAD(P)H nitroreductase n=1 Tax=Parvibaculum lavamentivorans (strain DS-1 / DSM 13023 / NCIMB 13966) TaxID=402881 RepID=A7HWJ9_PARL1|nr:nitroreductase [Parvibaculum lavamentivorans]ABS64282.1 nitroreductase [Parvibaculum lavamentivorans DS-1]
MARSQETIDLLLTRRSAKALTMVEPGPSEDELQTILRAGARVPDHGKLAPWRFIVFRGEARGQFGAVLRDVYARAQPGATNDQLDFEAGRLTRAPVVVAVISRVTPGIKIPEWEQLLSAGAVCQNMLIAATALGFGAQWLTEWYAFDAKVNEALGLGENEKVAGYLYFGSESVPKDERPRPELSEITSEWAAKG